MSDKVEIPFSNKPSDQATLLLAAAEDLGLDADVVQTYEGGFLVPPEVKDQAGLDKSKKDSVPRRAAPEPEAEAAKKTAAKKTAESKES